MAKKGKVYLVGAGPGDPGLLTIKGQAVLKRADCIVYDSLVNPELLCHARQETETLLVGKHGGRQATSQEEINRVLVAKAQMGKIVVRLKGGDPFVFGRGGEEVEALRRAGVPWEVVPGVSSGHAVPAYAGIPLTHRAFGSSVALITGHEDPAKPLPTLEWSKLATGVSTLVFFMAAKNLSEIVSLLVEHGRDPRTPVAVIRWGTRPEQEVVTGTLGDIPAKASHLSPPCLIVVGEVVRLRERLRWFEQLPLFGRRIIITRARGQSEPLAAALTGLGAQVVAFPTIEIRPPKSWKPLDAAIRRLKDFQYLLVTSVPGVENFFSRLRVCGLDARALGGIRVGAIGPGTAAALEKFGLRADLIPREYAAEGLLEALSGKRVKGKSILIPRARVARDILPATLRRRGARVKVVEAYHTVTPTVRPEEVERVFGAPPSLITFTSSSTAKNLVKILGRGSAAGLLDHVALASIGPVTSATLRELGFPVAVEAREFTIPGLVRAIEEFFSRQGNERGMRRVREALRDGTGLRD